ncbi:MAG: phage major tail tube protein [Burkholderiales bacterium]|nr:phage major tail tube protein [Burkholderiales bacterium]
MSLPRKLKNFALFVNGESYVGQVPEVTLPKLTRKTEDYRAGGMNGPISADLGMDKMEMKWTASGYIRSLLSQWATQTVGGVLLRFAGALQADDNAEITSMEVIVRGKHTELDFGKAEAGGKTEIQVSTAISYYKISLNGLPVIEIDFVNMIEIIDGTDLMVDVRTAIGLL